MCDLDARYSDQPKRLLHLWKHARFGKELLQEFDEAFMLTRIHRSQADMWWTQSCLRLRDFEMTKTGDWDEWLSHDLDRGHLSQEQKAYFEECAVWLCARCEDVGCRNGRKLARMAEDRRRSSIRYAPSTPVRARADTPPTPSAACAASSISCALVS